MERSLRKNMGYDPLCLDEDANSTSICWLDIVRHGDFQQQSDGCYHCSIQGKVFIHDQQLHNRVEFCRSHAPDISNAGPSHADVKREVGTTLEILTDISDELGDLSKYTKSLAKLERALKIRLSKLQCLLKPTRISPIPTSPAQYLTPNEPDAAISVERPRASSTAQSISSSGSGSSSESSESETTSDDDGDGSMAMSMDSSSEDSSEDESGDENAEDTPQNDESPNDKGLDDKGAEDNIPENNAPEGNGPDKNVSEDKATRDHSSKNVGGHQKSNNSDNGGNGAPDDAIVVPLNPLSSTTSYSTSLIVDDENVISAGHASLPGDIEKAASANPMSSKVPSSMSSPTENRNDVSMDPISSPKSPRVHRHLPLPKSPMRDEYITLLGSESPSPRPSKRQKFIDLPELQKESPKPSKKASLQERLIGAAWMKTHFDEEWNQRRFAEEYRIKFGHKRGYLTLKKWMDDEEKSQAESYIVVLKVPIPFLHEALLNDSSS
ncbi:unnamed protein product [Penicillium glandicola]